MKHEAELFKQKCKQHVLDNANRPIAKILEDILGSSVLPEDDFYKKSEKELTEWINLNKKVEAPK